MIDLEHAKDKVLMGVERKSMIIPLEERKITAYHEAGHTLVARMIPGTDPIHKVTIIPRGRALGLTQQLPIDEKHTYPKDYLLNNITIMLGGRAAEELVFNRQTTGAGNDIEHSTEIARKMVCEWGMSDKLGPLAYGQKDEEIFLGRQITRHKNYSEETAITIDDEIKKIVSNGMKRAEKILNDNEDTLHRLASALLEREILDSTEIDAVIRGEELPPVEKRGNGTPQLQPKNVQGTTPDSATAKR
jgi:cell division protease FtsH